MTTLDQTGRADLNDDALFDAEIVIGHRAVPYLKGQVLHSVSPVAPPLMPLGCSAHANDQDEDED